jgi:alginate O-acetyltransferase complex protein AlgI
MVFSSILFLFWFLPVVLALYHGMRAVLRPLAPRLWQPVRLVVLLVASLIFYAWGEPRLIGLMLVSAGTDYLAGLLMLRGPRPFVLAAALTVNLSLLFFFKYYHFVRALLPAALGLPALKGLTLPLGISFYTFKSMSYSIDVYRGAVAPTRDPLRFFCFVTLFPELVAGPIVRYASVATQLAADELDLAGVAYGVRRFVDGLAKKVLVANTLAVPVDAIWSLPASAVTPALAWLAAVAYALQIYFDFSGYSDMAIGLGRMFGFRFPENFDRPYAARSMKDFWRRWHISLSTWFRDYLYIPLGGDRRGPARTVVNLLLVFALCGLWHGASLNFLLWGLWHGAFLLLERTFPGFASGRPYVGLVVLLGWVPFRAPTLAAAASMLSPLVGLSAGDAFAQPLSLYATPPVLTALAAGLLLSLDLLPRPRPLPVVRLATLGALFAASVLSLAAGTHNPFIYYRF